VKFTGSDTEVPSTPETFPAVFAPSLSTEELFEQQGVSPVTNPDDLLADFWPDSESVEEFAATVRQWRDEGG